MASVVKLLKFCDQLVFNFSLYSLVVSIFTMLFLTIAAIALRPLNITALWIDPLVRHLVFLSAFLGGSLAISRKQLIAIDIFSKFLESRNKIFLKIQTGRIINLFCVVTLSWLMFGAIKFVKETIEYEGTDFLGIHKGVLVSIIPFGLSLLIYRFFFQFVSSFFKEE